jgi:hypothetical protein
MKERLGEKNRGAKQTSRTETKVLNSSRKAGYKANSPSSSNSSHNILANVGGTMEHTYWNQLNKSIGSDKKVKEKDD